MSGTLALASAIASMDQETLAHLVRQRRPQSASNVSDPIGLATELLRADTVARVLAPLNRRQLSLLLTLSEADGSTEPYDPRVLSELTRLGLVGIQGSSSEALPEVTAALMNGLATAGIDPATLGDASAEIAPRDPQPDTHTWYAAALTAVGEGSETLRTLRDHPGRLNRSGSVAVATVRALSELTSVEPSKTSLILAALDRARLLWPEPSKQRLTPGANAPAWLALSCGERWLVLAQTTLNAMPQALRAALETAGSDLAVAASMLPTMFPLLPAARRQIAEDFVATTDHLGITVQGLLSEPAKHVMADDLATARAILASELPPPAPGIYVQPDLSIVIPGSLDPANEADLASLSRPEHIGVATTRRVSELSLADAIERGVTATTAREIFTRLSLTGVPQPLDYLLASIAERAGSIKVGEHHGDEGQSRVSVSRPELADTILIDRSVQHLQFMRSAEDRGVLYSKLRPEHVIAALNAARYPASAAASLRAGGLGSASAPSPGETSSGEPHLLTSDDTAAQLSPELENLVKRVYLAARSEPGTGDFTRLLELAIRDRGTVRVTAEARGQAYVFTLLPVSLSGGRLRATDTAAGMERTLPVSTITAVETL
ncbi:hypothetical protein G7068_06970 [Leucobacter viscericola]|uniref:Helicase XPB/Ssl2 N-terminal domain-containing protein n=1 Tax=Leucobacter viscericola TaxID=2714935 RepID=A0A6G7XER9_9MICO|nr:helicase-associated domain-containing protein [Leucobacter viscericola]QIK62966.1 hypothetical protein G7068_06970 [Leucobacter viscericola]